MSVDFDALQAHQGPKAVLAPSTQISEAGHSDSVQGFDGLESVYVEVSVSFLRARFGARGLTLLLESSSNGSDWATEHTFSFGADGVASTTVDTPADYLRLSWTVANQSEWWLLSAFAAPPVINEAGGGGGGGSQPQQYDVTLLPVTAAASVGEKIAIIEFDLPAGLPDGGIIYAEWAWRVVAPTSDQEFLDVDVSVKVGSEESGRIGIYGGSGTAGTAIGRSYTRLQRVGDQIWVWNPSAQADPGYLIELHGLYNEVADANDIEVIDNLDFDSDQTIQIIGALEFDISDGSYTPLAACVWSIPMVS